MSGCFTRTGRWQCRRFLALGRDELGLGTRPVRAGSCCGILPVVAQYGKWMLRRAFRVRPRLDLGQGLGQRVLGQLGVVVCLQAQPPAVRQSEEATGKLGSDHSFHKRVL